MARREMTRIQVSCDNVDCRDHSTDRGELKKSWTEYDDHAEAYKDGWKCHMGQDFCCDGCLGAWQRLREYRATQEDIEF